MHSSIPDSIIDCNKQSFEQNISFIEKTDIGPTVNRNSCSQLEVPMHYKAASIDDINYPYRVSTDIDLVPIELPLDIDVEPITDVNIDQSMFDPKTLIQCTVHNDDIIPPPPQFSDFTTHSSGYDDIGNTNMACNYSQDSEPEIHKKSDDNLNDNENIFANQSITHLTPSREIETMTLDAEDSSEDSYSSPSAAKSFTVMRRNTPSLCDVPGYSSLTRQAKLRQFQFSQKNKLRKWK